MFHLITDKLAERRASRTQREHDRCTEAQEREHRKRQVEFEDIARTVFLEHIRECQEHGFERELKPDGIPVGIKNFFDPDRGVQKTEIIVLALEAREVLVIVFSRLAVRVGRTWYPLTDLKASPLQLYRKVRLEGHISWQLIPLP